MFTLVTLGKDDPDKAALDSATDATQPPVTRIIRIVGPSTDPRPLGEVQLTGGRGELTVEKVVAAARMWVRYNPDLAGGDGITAIAPDGLVVSISAEDVAEIRRAEAGPLPGRGVPPAPPTPRLDNHKIALPWTPGSLHPVPNIHNHGTRNLGLIVGGAAEWEAAPQGEALAVINKAPVGRIDLGSEHGIKDLTDRLTPRGIQTIVTVSHLVWEKTNHQPINRGARLTVGEVARAMGYEPGSDRTIDPEIRRRIARDILAASKVETWAADGAFDKKARVRPSGWIAPLIIVAAIHVERDENNVALPIEFDAMLGRNWAEAATRYDMLQVPPGFLALNEDAEIKLAWFYLTQFRYDMTKLRTGVRRAITALCEEARVDPGKGKHRGRFLDRLEKWHANLQRHGVIGGYERRPAAGTDLPPGEAFARGEYMTMPPRALLEKYREPRQQALQAGAKAKRRAPNGA